MARVLRKRLDHRTHFAGRFGAIYFVTICCQKRGSNQLCCEDTSKVLFDSARIYHQRGRWNLNLLLLMPDHLHALIGSDRDPSDVLRYVNGISSHRTINYLKERGFESSLQKLRHATGLRKHKYLAERMSGAMRRFCWSKTRRRSASWPGRRS